MNAFTSWLLWLAMNGGFAAAVWFALCVFVWYGHLATAAAWGVWMVANKIGRDGAVKFRAINEEARGETK